MKKSPLQTLHELGQSPWLDFIQRDLIRSGELARMIERYGIRGVTSNPAIFEKAIVGSEDYDASIAALAGQGRDANAVYEALALEDVQSAADAFRSMYDACDAGDGYVSLEVSPHLARDTEGTLAEARRLWAAFDRPNAMIKVPATEEGIPAIRTLISEGINVNVTLLFGLEAYRQVAEAYLAGLEQRAAAGGSLPRIASVASFFLSRIDSMVDADLERMREAGRIDEARAGALKGQAAVASALQAYGIYEELFGGERFRALREQGAAPQRLLWASTSTKDPKYSDVKYVEPLIGPDTVNTLPLPTIEAYHDHGRPEVRIRDGRDEAAQAFGQLAELGIEMEKVADRLVEEGIVKFVEPFDALLGAIHTKRAAVSS